MPKGIRPGTEMRCAMLQKCLEMGMPVRTLLDTFPMEGKSEEEKERIAANALAYLQKM